MKKSHISLSTKLSRCNTIITSNHDTNILKPLILFVCSQWNTSIILRITFNLSYRAHLFFLIFEVLSLMLFLWRLTDIAVPTHYLKQLRIRSKCLHHPSTIIIQIFHICSIYIPYITRIYSIFM